ncbi:hypothetical protein [Ruegeria halocynthiae]|uniref:hypothetical protein n=1 Tax=Ruegeria halocynthiae TaxID=985054 RepID=UPI0005697B4F|nr:hypothetical protein [Ruegeria halocynthiae]
MVQNNKVLTVSYGTFSCTLEGFDDSFETMKAIAEYFRDLAADDRYFGSEPPQPDAELLTRIAQRDASRKIEASQNDSGLLLRATDEAAAPVVAAAQPIARTPDHETIEQPSAAPPPVHSAASFFSEAEPVEETPAPASDSIAAKLQRIRAVVSHSEENSVIYTEDEDTSLMKNSGAPVDAVAAAFESGTLNPDDLQDEDTVESSDVLAATEEEIAPPSETMENVAETVTIPEPAVDETPSTDLDVEDTPYILAANQEAQPAPSEDETPAIEDDAPDHAISTDALFSDLDAAEDGEPDGEDVVNILNDVEFESDSDVAQDPAPQAENGILTEEDEVNLLHKLSEVEAVLKDQQSPEEPHLDQDVSRLMEKAGEQMEDPATNNQRETYSHLRAAVAATQAERGEDGNAKQDDEDAGYRNDLTSVVSPRRPEIQVTSMRPETDASAPLKLVAEQRVDTSQNVDTGPVMPRRVTAQPEKDAPEEGGFALFAQEQGAQSLLDLLEAAAAYLSFIEGQEQFSRPQLMNKIRSLKQDEFNREESLRSFGQLLRDGKIEKAGGGRFAASTQIGFRPDDKRAAG